MKYGVPGWLHNLPDPAYIPGSGERRKLLLPGQLDYTCVCTIQIDRGECATQHNINPQISSAPWERLQLPCTWMYDTIQPCAHTRLVSARYKSMGAANGWHGSTAHRAPYPLRGSIARATPYETQTTSCHPRYSPAVALRVDSWQRRRSRATGIRAANWRCVDRLVVDSSCRLTPGGSP